MLWTAAGSVAGNGVGVNALDRLALAEFHDETDRMCAFVCVICAFGIYHVAKVPWAAAPRPMPLEFSGPFEFSGPGPQRCARPS